MPSLFVEHCNDRSKDLGCSVIAVTLYFVLRCTREHQPINCLAAEWRLDTLIRYMSAPYITFLVLDRRVLRQVTVSERIADTHESDAVFITQIKVWYATLYLLSAGLVLLEEAHSGVEHGVYERRIEQTLLGERVANEQ